VNLKGGLQGKEKKRKITPVYKYQHEYEPVDRALIAGFRDAIYGVMPPLITLVT
jgi:hypothetical protein